MSRDVLEIVQKMDKEGLEWQMAMQCAPLLMGIKISNLVILPVGCKAAILRLLCGSDLSCFILRETKHQVTMLVYRKDELKEFLLQPEVTDILRQEGYRDFPGHDARSLALTLLELRHRYEDCRRGEGDFPHEMGVFLGYPVEDVRGFIRCNGQHFLCSGYWKVYADVEKKRAIFASYEEARDEVIRLLHRGLTLADLLRGRGMEGRKEPA